MLSDNPPLLYAAPIYKLAKSTQESAIAIHAYAKQLSRESEKRRL